MTMIPEMRRCRKCKRMYSWNPDVGNLACPYCGHISSMTGLGDILGEIFDKKKKR